MIPSKAPCKLAQPPCSERARARRMSALALIRRMSSFRRSSLAIFSSAWPSSSSSSASSMQPSSLFAVSLAPGSASALAPSVLVVMASSLSSASRDFVASSMAAFQSESLRWQAAMLAFRTAISYSR